MIESIEIENLRGVRTGKLDRLAAINVVVGPNNSGKSTVLEAFAVLAAPQNIAGVVDQLLSRGGSPHAALSRCFTDATKPARAKARMVSTGSITELDVRLSRLGSRPANVAQQAYAEGFGEPLETIQVDVNRSGAIGLSGASKLVVLVSRDGKMAVPTHLGGNPLVTGAPLRVVGLPSRGSLEDDLTVVENANGVGLLIDALKASLSGLTDLRILKLGDEFVAHARIGDAPPIPIYLLGDGAKRLLSIAAGVLAKRDETVLLEEPEAFQHPRYLREIVKLLVTYASAGAQYVMTTHSIELLDFILEELSARGSDAPTLAVHRTQLINGELRATTLDGDFARAARQDLLQDLRG